MSNKLEEMSAGDKLRGFKALQENLFYQYLQDRVRAQLGTLESIIESRIDPQIDGLNHIIFQQQAIGERVGLRETNKILQDVILELEERTNE